MSNQGLGIFKTILGVSLGFMILLLLVGIYLLLFGDSGESYTAEGQKFNQALSTLLSSVLIAFGGLMSLVLGSALILVNKKLGKGRK